MPNNREYSGPEIAIALKVFKRFLEEQQCIVVADEFYEWCNEQMKGGNDVSERQDR